MKLRILKAGGHCKPSRAWPVRRRDPIETFSPPWTPGLVGCGLVARFSGGKFLKSKGLDDRDAVKGLG
jgi:hypothetical protein